MSIASVSKFVELIQQSRLLEPAQLQELESKLAKQFPDLKALAKELIKRGWLTVYQANQVLSGKTKDLFLGPYVLLERLGEGGMGQVFKGKHRGLGRIAALKVIRKERLVNEDAVKRFQREVRAAAQLSHPNVVLAYDADESGGTHFIAMEYVDGMDLSKLVKEKGPLPVPDACEYLRQVALGLQHAHEKGLVHRDIKPQNLMIADCGLRIADSPAQSAIRNPKSAIVKILDMGLARLAPHSEESSTLTQEGSVMGTLDYISPEQAMNSHTVDIRGDLYSLGCTFYFLLSGRVPFPGGTVLEKLLKHRLEEPPPIEDLRPEVPPAVAEIVRTLMAKSPDDRYQTPGELAEVLGAYLKEGQEPTVALPGKDKPAAPASSDSGTDESMSQDTAARWASIVAERPARPAPAPTPARPPGSTRRLAPLAWIGGGIAAALLVLVGIIVIAWPKGDSENGTTAGATPTKPAEKKPEPAKRLTPEQEEELARQKREAEAEEAIKPLEAKFKQPGVPFESFAKDVQDFKGKYGGTPAAIKAAELLMKLPAPLDQLDPAKIPAYELEVARRAAGREPPVELIAILGDSRLKDWAEVRSVAFSPDGKTLASASDDGTVKLWDPATGSELRTLKGHTHHVRSVAFSKDGKTLASGSYDQTVKLWDPAAGSELRTLKGHTGAVYSVAFNPDGETLASGSVDGTVKLWDPVVGSELHTLKGHIGVVLSVAFSKDGKTLASGSHDETVKLWDPAAGSELRTLKGHTKPVYSVAFSPDGKTLASGSYDNTVKLWDPAAGSELRTLKGNINEVASVAFSPDGKTLASGSADGPIKLWDPAAGSELRTLKGHNSNVLSVAFSPDGKTLASASYDGAVKLWDPAAGSELITPKGHTKQVYSVAFSPDGKTLASGSGDQTVKLWDPAAGSELRTLKGHTNAVVSVAFSPDGKTLASGSYDFTVKLWDPAAGSELRTLKGHTSYVWSVAFSPDGKTLASGSADKTVKLWDPAAGSELRTLKGHTNAVVSVAFSPDGKTLASAALDGTVRLWDPGSATTKQVFPVGPTLGHVLQVAFAADGRHLATANGNGTVYIFRLAPPVVTNSIGMKLAHIPAGKFLMGKPDAELGGKGDEGPQHEVTISQPFFMGVFEVRQDEYEKVLGKNPSAVKNNQYPVTNVSWFGAEEFCKRLSDLEEEKKAGRVYRLPTEAEWEYACRAGTTSPFAFGNALSSEQANFNGKFPYGGAAAGPHLDRPDKVGSYQPNGFGLYDLHGNVWEWVADAYGPYAPDAVTDPKGPAGQAKERVFRGGSFETTGGECRSAHRLGKPPGLSYDGVGFRVVMEQRPMGKDSQ